MRTDESTDRTLLARAAGGDGSAFAAIHDRHVRPVYWQAYTVLRDASTNVRFLLDDGTLSAPVTNGEWTHRGGNAAHAPGHHSPPAAYAR